MYWAKIYHGRMADVHCGFPGSSSSTLSVTGIHPSKNTQYKLTESVFLRILYDFTVHFFASSHKLYIPNVVSPSTRQFPWNLNEVNGQWQCSAGYLGTPVADCEVPCGADGRLKLEAVKI